MAKTLKEILIFISPKILLFTEQFQWQDQPKDKAKLELLDKVLNQEVGMSILNGVFLKHKLFTERKLQIGFIARLLLKI
jgi:hypothetical protein